MCDLISFFNNVFVFFDIITIIIIFLGIISLLTVCRESGFWASHLGKKPYHISALYVVDLKRFRALRAGDSLRSVYNSLSQDPNSLSNLDQVHLAIICVLYI
jgi:hypothetical protein